MDGNTGASYAGQAGLTTLIHAVPPTLIADRAAPAAAFAWMIEPFSN